MPQHTALPLCLCRDCRGRRRRDENFVGPFASCDGGAAIGRRRKQVDLVVPFLAGDHEALDVDCARVSPRAVHLQAIDHKLVRERSADDDHCVEALPAVHIHSSVLVVLDVIVPNLTRQDCCFVAFRNQPLPDLLVGLVLQREAAYREVVVARVAVQDNFRIVGLHVEFVVAVHPKGAQRGQVSC